IEATIRRCGWVQDTVVMAREDEPGDKRLVAYIQPRPVYDGADIERCAEWRELFQAVYAASRNEISASHGAESADPAFNIAGWNNSYDGQPLPTAQMQEWLDDTVARIMDLKPARVLEIGCGTGL